MLSHKRAKEAFEAMKGWSLYSYVLFHEKIRPRSPTGDVDVFRSRGERITACLTRAVRLAVDRDESAASKQLQASCNKALKKRKRDELDGEIPTWVKVGALVEAEVAPYYRDRGKYEIVEVLPDRQVVSLRLREVYLYGREEPRVYSDIPFTKLWRNVDHFSSEMRVEIIAGDFQGLQETVLDVYRSRVFFRDSKGRILKANPRHLVSMGYESPYIDVPESRPSSFRNYIPPLEDSSS